MKGTECGYHPNFEDDNEYGNASVDAPRCKKALSLGSRSAKAEQGDPQTQSNPSSKVDAKRIRKSMKAVRRISRF